MTNLRTVTATLKVQEPTDEQLFLYGVIRGCYTSKVKVVSRLLLKEKVARRRRS
jgi:hypothetical protein